LGGVGVANLHLPLLSHLSVLLCLSPLRVGAALRSHCVSVGDLPLGLSHSTNLNGRGRDPVPRRDSASTGGISLLPQVISRSALPSRHF